MKKAFGFTLIELMIAVAVVALLAAVALPSYQGQLRKSRRGAAQAFMADVAQREQARFLDARSYLAIANNAAYPGALGLTVPADVSSHYNVAVTCVVPGATVASGCTAGAPPSFTVTAVATSAAQDYKNEEDLRLCSGQCPGTVYERARGDAAGNSWDPGKW